MSFDISFRIIGESLDPDEVSKELSLECDSGSVLEYNNVGVWIIESMPTNNKDITCQVLSLLDKIRPCKAMIHEYKKRGYTLDIYCGYFFKEEDQPGFGISSEILSEMGQLGIDLGMNMYNTC